MNSLLSILFGASWKTSLTGYALAVLIALVDYLAAGIDTSTPEKKTIFWSGLVTALIMAIKGRVTKDSNVSNSPTPLSSPQAVVPVTSAAPDIDPVPLAHPVPTTATVGSHKF